MSATLHVFPKSPEAQIASRRKNLAPKFDRPKFGYSFYVFRIPNAPNACAELIVPRVGNAPETTKAFTERFKNKGFDLAASLGYTLYDYVASTGTKQQSAGEKARFDQGDAARKGG